MTVRSEKPVIPCIPGFKAVVIAIIGMTLLFPFSSFAWDRIGHDVAAKIAEDHLSPHAKAALASLIGEGVLLSDIANWADEQDELARTGAWHYVNVPINDSRYDKRYCSAGGCVVSRIEDFRRLLENPEASSTQKQLALRFLVHFIADLHQPLHVGDDNDKGGNLLKVRFFGKESNLHRVWDSQIIERHTENEKVWIWDATFWANPKAIAEWSMGSPEDWATESLNLSKGVRSLPGSRAHMKSGTNISREYCKVWVPVIQKQLAKAGIRTAWMLNQIFK